MKLYHIAAISETNIIAKGDVIPWDLKEDLRRFAQITKGHAIIMGRATFTSMGSRPLPNRVNVVLTSSSPATVEGVVFCTSIEDALLHCHKQHEVYIIGGGVVYKDTLHLVDELRITLVHEPIEEDDDTCVYYPEIDESEWATSFVEIHPTHTYLDYVRRSPI
jgi:dihydrofolate reductase